MNLDAPGLENQIVRLEPFALAHLDLLKESNAIEAMWAWMADIPTGKSADAYAAHILAQQKRGEVLAFTIFRKSDDAFAGVVDYEYISRMHRRLRIANFWHPVEMRGTGIFQASQEALIRRALDWGARRIGWSVPAAAEPAVRAVEKLGAQREGVLRSYFRLAGGGWADMVVLSMLREEAEIALHRLQVARELADERRDAAT